METQIQQVRTQDEIVVKYRDGQTSDVFGFTADVLLQYLDVDHLREFCKPDADLSDWKQSPLERERIVGEMRAYMEFAWGKATGHRGISAERSVEKFRAWLWLLGDDETLAFATDDANYPNYGAPILMAISRKYGFAVPDGEDVERMAKGLSCSDDCDEGCGG